MGPPCVRDAQARGWGAPWAWRRVLEALGVGSAVLPRRALLPGFRTAKLRACSTGPSCSRPTRAPPARAGAVRRGAPPGRAGAVQRTHHRAELALSDAHHRGRAGAVRRMPPGPSWTRRPWLPSWSAPPARAGTVRCARHWPELALSDARLQWAELALSRCRTRTLLHRLSLSGHADTLHRRTGVALTRSTSLD
jgi:hypothetical protein